MQDAEQQVLAMSHLSSDFISWVSSTFPGWSHFDTSFPLMQFRYPAMGCLLYFLSHMALAPPKSSLNPKQKKPATPTSSKLKTFCAFHNFALMAFSAMCFYSTVPVAFGILSNGLEYASCVSGFKDPELWRFEAGSYGFWVWLFYLSKFYEFVDTFIVIAKNRRPIVLQVYHHIGAVFGMWLVVGSHCCQSWLFVCFNSFVHTVMYAYYCYSSLGFRFKYKSLITVLQMAQLITGNVIGTYMVGRYYFWERCPLYTNWDALACTSILCYTTVLVILFRRFYQRSYKQKKAALKAQKKA